jgi:hypothetical protein
MVEIRLRRMNLDNTIRNCTEVFGLPKAGKTTLLRKSFKQEEVLNWNGVSNKRKLALFFSYLSKNTLNSFLLFWKMNTNWIGLKELTWNDYWVIFRMRNSYLVSVLAKYQHIVDLRKEILTDEFFLQSLFMILHRKSTAREIGEIVKLLGFSRNLVLVEAEDKERYRRLGKIKKFSRNLDSKFKMVWWKNIEYNYKLIREGIFEEYIRVK